MPSFFCALSSEKDPRAIDDMSDAIVHATHGSLLSLYIGVRVPGGSGVLVLLGSILHFETCNRT